MHALDKRLDEVGSRMAWELAGTITQLTGRRILAPESSRSPSRRMSRLSTLLGLLGVTGETTLRLLR